MRLGLVAGAGRALLAAACLLVAACADTGGIVPRGQAVDAATLDPGAAVRAAARNANWPDQQWWRALNDAQLSRLIDVALADSPTLGEATARARAAQALAGVSNSATLPNVDARVAITRQHWPDNVFYGPGPLADADTWNNTATLALSFDPDLAGGRRSAAREALGEARAAAALARAAQLELTLSITQAYVRLSTLYTLRDIDRASLERQQRVSRFAASRLRVGLGTELENTQAQSPLPEMARQIEEVDTRIALARHQLAALAGRDPGYGEGLTRPTLKLTAAPGLPAVLPAELIGHRPDVVAARWRVEAASQGIAVAHAAFYPDINLVASFGGMAAAGGPLTFLKAMSFGYSAGPAISLPIFDGGRLRAQYGVATARYDDAVQAYNRVVLGALQNVADVLVQDASTRRQQALARQSERLARRGYDLALKGFRLGLTDYLNVLNAQDRLLAEHRVAANLAAARLSNYAALCAALGGALEPTTADVPRPVATAGVPHSATAGARP